MFILKDEYKAWWPVKVKEPDEKVAGRFINYQFEVEFRLIDRDEAATQNETREAIIDAGKAGSRPAAEILRDIENFDDESFVGVITNWRGVFDADKAEIPFSQDYLRMGLKRPHIRRAIADAYVEMMSGEIRKKN